MPFNKLKTPIDKPTIGVLIHIIFYAKKKKQFNDDYYSYTKK